MLNRMSARAGVGLLWVVASLACGQRTTNLVSSKKPSDASVALPDAPMDASPQPHDAAPHNVPDGAPGVVFDDAGTVLCGSSPCACSNGLDDDGDGAIDGFDGECTGPYDQDEATFATGEVKEGNPLCQDCYFDGNPTSSDDGCSVATSCGQDGTASGGSGACRTCSASPRCQNSCLPRTPNGCDCFGCCEVQGASGQIAILLVDTCSLDHIEDATKCPRCAPSPDCRNECGRCELCPGKTPLDVPPDCKQGGGPGYACENGEVCGPELACPRREYCVQGCCVPVVM